MVGEEVAALLEGVGVEGLDQAPRPLVERAPPRAEEAPVRRLLRERVAEGARRLGRLGSPVEEPVPLQLGEDRVGRLRAVPERAQELERDLAAEDRGDLEEALQDFKKEREQALEKVIAKLK